MQTPHPIILQLVELDTLKTWSLIVTLFGDLDGDVLTGTQIRLLLGHIGIKPEAIRVALHRLKSDGWITSTKTGREAVYQMSPRARSETAAVAPDIYRKRIKPKECWEFHLVEEPPITSGGILLNRNLALVEVGARPSGHEALVLAAQNQVIPQWVAASLVPEAILNRASKLGLQVDRFSEVERPFDKRIFRLLVLHHWRRIALRSGAWAHASFLPGGEIAVCHAKVVALLNATDKIDATPLLQKSV